MPNQQTSKERAYAQYRDELRFEPTERQAFMLGFDAGMRAAHEPPAEPFTDDEIRRLWRAAGGHFHGPNVETGTMTEARLLPFLRHLLDEAPSQPPVPDPWHAEQIEAMVKRVEECELSEDDGPLLVSMLRSVPTKGEAL